MKSYLRFLLALFVATFFLVGLQSGAALAVPTTPTADFTDNGDGTATHRITGLTWKRCAEGQTWSGSTCTGTAQTYTWAQAIALTSTFAGNSDWRLPTVRELSTITEMESYLPVINGTIFPNTPASDFWSASSYTGYSDFAWYVGFENGSIYYNHKTISVYVRLVRGGQSVGLLALSRPTTDYVDNGDGTVTHTPTALTWKRCAEGQTWSGSTCTGTTATYTWTAATALTGTFAGKSDWRLPTMAELRSLVDFNLVNLSINSTIFPNTSTSNFWSASAYAGFSNRAWGINFNYGYAFTDYREDGYNVRLVRGGQSLGSLVSLSGLNLTCPATFNAGTSGSCSVTANYSDASTKPANATWSSSNPTVLSVDSSGKLTAGTPSSDTPVTITASFTEGGITKTAAGTVTVKAAIAKLTGLTISGDAGVKSGFSIALTAKASYSDGASHEVSATWVSSDSTIATVSGAGLVTAKTVTTDTPVTITASYAENGVTQTATWMVSVKAVVPVLTDLILSGADTLEAGKTATYTAKAVYSDGNSKPAGNITWTSSGMGATIDAQGVLTADAKLSADAVVTITAIYTENGVTKTAQMKVNIKAGVITSACGGSGANLSAITVVGSSVKKPGDSLEVNYCLKNYNSSTWFDVYVAVQLPDGSLLFMKSAGFFDTPTFTAEVVPYLANTLIPDKSGKVLQMSALSMGLPTGTYTFYAIPVLAGKNVMTGFNWVGELASGKINFNR